MALPLVFLHGSKLSKFNINYYSLESLARDLVIWNYREETHVHNWPPMATMLHLLNRSTPTYNHKIVVLVG